MILVVCALPEELPGFASSERTEILSSGVGPTEAAAATARALASRRYDAVVSAGIAGAFRDCAHVGDACVIGEERYADFGREDGSPIALPGGATLATRSFASPLLLERTRFLPYRIVVGLTTTRITQTTTTAERLRAAYRADVESMEGFAVFRAAERAGVPAIGVRGISNIVGPRAEGAWNFQAGARAATAALTTLLEVFH